MIQITITGPGQTFDLELAVIKEALEAEGFPVEIHDAYPNTDHTTLEQLRKFFADRNADYAEKGISPVRKGKVVITTEHCPWGG